MFACCTSRVYDSVSPSWRFTRVSISMILLVIGLKKYSPSGSDVGGDFAEAGLHAALPGVDHLDAAARDADDNDGDDDDHRPHEDLADGQVDSAAACVARAAKNVVRESHDRFSLEPD